MALGEGGAGGWGGGTGEGEGGMQGRWALDLYLGRMSICLRFLVALASRVAVVLGGGGVRGVRGVRGRRRIVCCGRLLML